MVMKAALEEREKQLQEVRQARSQKKEVDPVLLQYQQQVGLEWNSVVIL